MNFDLDDDQRTFASAARDYFGAEASPSAVRAQLDSDAPVRPGLAGLAEVGFLGITVPESAGGAGQSVLDLAVVAEQAGRVLAGPSLVTAGRAAELLAGEKTLLAALADGTSAFAVLDGPVLPLVGGTVTGTSAPSLDVVGATGYLVRTGAGPALVQAGQGTSVLAGTPLDPSRGLARVRMSGAPARLLAAGDSWERAWQVGAVLLAAESLGAAGRCLELGIGYAKLRHAFGRPIGSYQAVKHALVDSFVTVEQLRSLVWYAAWTADQAPAELPLAASAAKAFAADSFERTAETLIQVHGGIGFTWEHDAHLYWRRAKVDRLLLGDAASHRDTVARLALAGESWPAADPGPATTEDMSLAGARS